MKKYTLLAITLLLSLTLVMAGCDSWNEPSAEATTDTTDTTDIADLTTEEPTTEAPTTEEPTTEPPTEENGTTEEIPEHTGDYSVPY